MGSISIGLALFMAIQATNQTHTDKMNVWQCSKKWHPYTWIQQPCNSHAIGLEIFGHRHR